MASLFRNFLLAERVMRSYNCTPESHPSLPPTYHHCMWQAWDLALDHIMAQLPALIDKQVNYEVFFVLPVCVGEMLWHVVLLWFVYRFHHSALPVLCSAARCIPSVADQWLATKVTSRAAAHSFAVFAESGTSSAGTGTAGKVP